LEKVVAEVAASVWKVLIRPGDHVDPGESLIILESMKMEIPVEATGGGIVVELLVKEGDNVAEGQHVATIG